MLETIPKITFWDIIDILIVAFLIYRVFLYLSETRAIQILVGLFILLVFRVIAKFLHLYTLSFIF
ncbi:MAG: TIGR00159 family protein, partial [Desulfurobacteriaceae bacterium]